MAAETDDARMNEGVIGRTLGDLHEVGLEKLEHGAAHPGAYEPTAIDAKGIKFFRGMLPKSYSATPIAWPVFRESAGSRARTHTDISFALLSACTPCAATGNRCDGGTPLAALHIMLLINSP